jgi:alkylation response protein AidB-like acyl-CoA dehydrogenase
VATKLAAARYVGIQWPKEHGGRGATLKEQIIFTEEMARVRAPEILDAVAVNIVGSTAAARRHRRAEGRYLPRILSATRSGASGFSEPNAGSDLASLRTRAVLDGDHWVVTGQKVWSSKAHFADWLLLLVRTIPTSRSTRASRASSPT